MNEAERCDRISLMHAGQASWRSTARVNSLAASNVESLEEAFIAYLQDADVETRCDQRRTREPLVARERAMRVPTLQHDARLRAFASREFTEICRDPIRLAFALLGPLILLVTFGYGITFDVERLPFAVLDNDQYARKP